MSIITGNTVMGIFDDQGQAHQAVIELRLAGFRDADVGIIASHSHRRDSSPLTSAAPEVPDDDSETSGAETLGSLSLVPLSLPAVGPVVVGGFLSTLAGSAGRRVGRRAGVQSDGHGSAREPCKGNGSDAVVQLYHRQRAYRSAADRGRYDPGLGWRPA